MADNVISVQAFKTKWLALLDSGVDFEREREENNADALRIF